MTNHGLNNLIERSSSPRVTDPAPNEEQLKKMIQAALRAADHGGLRPWRYIVTSGDAREKLGEEFLKIALSENPQLEDSQQQKIKSKPFRAPMIITAICQPVDHPKVPIWEQELSTAAACQNIINAAYMMGIGAYWRTGKVIFSPRLKKYFNVSEKGSIIGFIYLGTPIKEMKKSNKSNDWESYLKYNNK